MTAQAPEHATAGAREPGALLARATNRNWLTDDRVAGAGSGEAVAGRVMRDALPTFGDIDGAPRGESGPCAVELSRAAAVALRNDADPAGAFATLVCALALVLRRYAGTDDLRIGAPARADALAAHHPLISVRLAPDARLSDALHEIRRAVQQTLTIDHRDWTDGLSPSAQDGGVRGACTFGCIDDRLHGGVRAVRGCDHLLILRAINEPARLELEYPDGLYDRATAARFLDNVSHVVQSIPANLARPVGRVAVLCERERQTIRAFNPAPTPFPSATIDELFEAQAASHPDRDALCFDGAAVGYGVLDRRAGALAEILRTRGVGAGDRAAILAERAPESVIAMLAVLKVGASYVPIGLDNPNSRKNLIFQEAGCRVLLTSARTREFVPTTLPAERIVCIDAGDEAPAGSFHGRRSHDQHDLAYVMHTSGTTGRPKGVMVSHAAVVRLVRETRYIPFDEGGRLLQTSALAFDASIFEIWGALLNGWTLVFPPSGSLLSAPELEELIERNEISALLLTTPLFNLLSEADPAIFRPLKWLVVGGSVVSPRAVARVRTNCPGVHVVNAYGPTENTTISTTFPIERHYTSRVPIGRPIANSTAFVLDRDDDLAPIGVLGELCVGGAGLARGYLNDTQLTSRRFVELPEFGRLYRTGDIARWLPDGNLDLLGRADDQVKIRGYRVEPAEVEAWMRNLPGVRDIAVLATAEQDGSALVAYVVTDQPDREALRSAARSVLPDYMVPAHFLFLPALPLNANGKLDKAALPRPPSRAAPPHGEVRGNAARPVIERLWRSALEIDNVDPDDDFFALGGHSMKALQLINAVHKNLSVKIGLQDFFQNATVAKLSALVERAQAVSDEQPFAPPAGDHPVELSVSQRRLAELYEQDPSNPAFNIVSRTTWQEPVDLETARRVLEILANRHEALRTSFPNTAGKRLHAVTDSGQINLEYDDLSGLTEHEREERRRAHAEGSRENPFRLESGALYRLTIVKLDPQLFDIIWTIHHIIADGWSVDVLTNEFADVYRSLRGGEPVRLDPVPVQFRDYVAWHNRLLADKQAIAPAVRFWKQTLAAPIAMVELPFDRRVPNITVGMPSAGLRACVTADVTRRMREFAKEHQTNLFMPLLAAFIRLLRRCSGQTDIITGIPSANRQRDEVKGTVGFFVDSVVVRIPRTDEEPFSELTRQVNRLTLAALDHAHYPIELACAAAGTTWPQILSSFFNLSTFGEANRRPLGDTGWHHLDEVQNAKLPLVFYLEERKDGVEVNIHYYRDLFDPATIEALFASYIHIMEQGDCAPLRRTSP